MWQPIPHAGEILWADINARQSPIAMNVHTEVPRAKRCRHCDHPLSRHDQFSGGICHRPACRARDLEIELIDFRQRTLLSLGASDAATIPIVVVPHRSGRIVPMEPESRSAFEAHLREVAHDIAHADDAFEANTEAAAMLEAGWAADAADARERVAAGVCGACGGFCCYPGGANSAFIDAQTMRRYAVTHPEIGPEDVVAAYASHVPEQHFEGSCVYHTAAGCSLPRQMRSEVCNEYACKGLNDARAAQADRPIERLFVVARHDNRIVRGTLIDAAQSSEVSDLTDFKPG
jgi:hypothetical protein